MATEGLPSAAPASASDRAASSFVRPTNWGLDTPALMRAVCSVEWSALPVVDPAGAKEFADAARSVRGPSALCATTFHVVPRPEAQGGCDGHGV